MGDVLKVIRFNADEPRGCDGRDRHPMSAVRAGKKETWQVRGGNALERHGVLLDPTRSVHPAYFRSDSRESQEKFVQRT